MQASISIDGVEKAHNTFRKTREGVPTFSVLQEKIDLLLKYQPYSKVLMTVSPETLEYYAESVEYLLNRGFKYLIVSLNYAGNWTDGHIQELSEQYNKIAKLYEKLILKEQKFYFSPFEMKLATHIRQDNIECYYCHLAKRQISIAYNGDIYPCVQFVKDGVSNTSYKIGDIESGINVELQNEIYKESKLQFDVCKECDYNPRCNNKCSCLNWQLTGEINRIFYVLCETERVLFPVIETWAKDNTKTVVRCLSKSITMLFTQFYQCLKIYTVRVKNDKDVLHLENVGHLLFFKSFCLIL